MRCIAHRGFAETYPENTVTAVRSAFERVDAVEIDVRRCETGEPVVIHDEAVDRITEATGEVSEYTAAELAGMDVLGSDDGIPTLDRVLEAAPDGANLNVELKERGLAADVRRLVAGRNVDLLVSSFSESILKEAADAGLSQLAYLSAEDSMDGMLNVARELDCAAIHPHWQLCVDAFVERAHEAGFLVNAWTVPSRHDANALDVVAVDGIIVDRPDVCLGQ